LGGEGSGPPLTFPSTFSRNSCTTAKGSSSSSCAVLVSLPPAPHLWTWLGTGAARMH
jgi:hypothetical protein